MRRVVVARDVKFLETKREEVTDECDARELFQVPGCSDDEVAEPGTPPNLYDPVLRKRTSPLHQQVPETPVASVQPEVRNRRAPGRPRLLRTDYLQRH